MKSEFVCVVVVREFIFKFLIIIINNVNVYFFLLSCSVDGYSVPAILKPLSDLFGCFCILRIGKTVFISEKHWSIYMYKHA